MCNVNDWESRNRRACQYLSNLTKSKKKMKITLSAKRFDLIKLIIQHIDSTIKKVNSKFLSICYVIIREKRFKSNTNFEYDVFKRYWAKVTKLKLWVIRALNYDSENYENMRLIFSKNETSTWTLSFFELSSMLLRTWNDCWLLINSR